MSFRQKLAFGQKYQEIAKRYIPADENFLEDAQGNIKEFDFKTDKFSYEVKSDRMGHAYGCQTFFIEYECNGKPSGISATKSDFYFYFFHKPDESYVAYEIPTETLRKACIGCREILKAGDGGRVKGYVVPVIQEFLL
jgi:hypothetical protein